MGLENAAKPEDFITALMKLQEECGVSGENEQLWILRQMKP